MKKIFIVLFISLLTVSSVSMAQDDNYPATASGSTALLFEFNGFDNLRANNFEGGMGAKMYFTRNLALRGSLQFAHANVDIPANPPAGQTGTDGSQSGTTFGLSVAVEYHLAQRRVSPYIGGGASFSSTSTESETATIGNTPQVTVKNRFGGENVNGQTFTAGTEFGIFALAGAEFFLFRELSLSAEYRLGFSSLSQKDQEATVGNTTSTTTGGSATGFGITSQGVFTLAFYF